MTDKTGKKQQNGRFPPGTSGNPSGRPRGARNKALLLLEQIGEEAAESILKKVILKARRGDMRAADTVLRRIWPEPHGRKVLFRIPPIRSAIDAPLAIAAIIAAIGEGILTPAEGRECANLVANYTQSLQAHSFEQRIENLNKVAREIDEHLGRGHDEEI